MSVFVDSTVWFAAAVARDQDNSRARDILASTRAHVTTDHVMVETWLLLAGLYGHTAANRVWDAVDAARVKVETATAADLRAAGSAELAASDVGMVDRISAAVMDRLGIVQVASFSDAFHTLRCGPRRDRAFEVIGSGHSPVFLLFRNAILSRSLIACSYKGRQRVICPHVLGHKREQEKAVVYDAERKRDTARPQDWECWDLANVEAPEIRSGAWRGGDGHHRQPRCVEQVYLDMDPTIPNQRGRN